MVFKIIAVVALLCSLWAAYGVYENTMALKAILHIIEFRATHEKEDNNADSN